MYKKKEKYGPFIEKQAENKNCLLEEPRYWTSRQKPENYKYVLRGK